MNKSGCALLICLVFFSCARFPRFNNLPVVDSEPQRRKIIAGLEAIARGTRPCANLIMESGEGGGREGSLTVQVAKNQVQVTHSFDHKETHYNGRVSEIECRRLVHTVVAGKLWTVKSKRAVGVPDETHAMIGMGIRGVGMTHVSIWAGETSE